MAPSKNHPRITSFNLTPTVKFEFPEAIRERPHLSVDDELLHAGHKPKLHIIELCCAISHGCSVQAVKTYLQHYREDEDDFKVMMNIATPVLYFAIARNSPELVSVLLEYGLNRDGPDDDMDYIPPVAFAVIHGQLRSLDTTEVVKVLLGHGVDPHVIPEDMWVDYLEKPKYAWPLKLKQRSAKSKWCDDQSRSHLMLGLNLSMRYYLFRASLCKPFTTRELQSAETYNIMGLLKIPYRIVGQIPAVELVRKVIVNHIASNADDPEPLTMVFAGPPGHGKTELAQQLGDLLSVEHETIACSQMGSDTELLGSKMGFEGAKQGSKLNNHLSRNNGSCAVAFLDEFDKTSTEVCHALLTMMEGTYIDRRTNRVIDCRKTIWILASNLGEQAIARFYETSLKLKRDGEKATTDLGSLIAELRTSFQGRWGDAFESRIDRVIPFFPFSAGEQAVVAHKFLLKNAAKVRKQIDLRPEIKRLMGHCNITYFDDGKLCSHMANRGYHKSSGARGLKREAKLVETKAREVYNEIPGLVLETLNEGPFTELEVKLMPLADNKYEIGVFQRHDD